MNTLCKAERLYSKIVIEKMFAGGASRSFSVFPLRAVYMSVDRQEVPASILISVPKKRFKRAVKRNRVKRQIREAYRKNKGGLWQALEEKEQGVAVAFIYLSNELFFSAMRASKIFTLFSISAEENNSFDR